MISSIGGNDAMVLTPTHLRFAGRRFPCTIGRGGLTDKKREGDMATPRAKLRIVAVMYRPDRVTAPNDWAKPILPGDLWSDDVRDPCYNKLVRVPHYFSHEDLRRADPMYDIVVVTNWNIAGVAEKGSAIFMHQWRSPGYPTAGCIALSRKNLHWIASHITFGQLLDIA